MPGRTRIDETDPGGTFKAALIHAHTALYRQSRAKLRRRAP
jgi:hypothetical protein